MIRGFHALGNLAIGYSALVAAEVPATIRLKKPVQLINAPMAPSQEEMLPQVTSYAQNM